MSDALQWPGQWPVGQLLAIGTLILLSALCTATEAALLNVSRYRLRNLVRLGNRSARRAELLLAQADQLMATLLLCKLVITVSVAVLTGLVAQQLGGVPLVIVALVLLTLVLLIVGDMVARTCGTLYAETLALPAAWVCAVLLHALQPVLWFSRTVASGLLRILGSRANPAAEPSLNDSDVRPSTTGPAHQRMLASILDLQSVTVEDIMVPRSEIASIDVEDDWDSILDMLRTTPHTRLPLCEGNLDNIVGMLHMKKVAHALAHGELSQQTLLKLARERDAYFVPDGTTLDVQLRNFQRDRRRIALVVDEYGDIRGLVTLEDILEEIVGEFTSDPGTLHKDIHQEADGAYLVNGAINVRVLNRTLGWNLPTKGPRTLNGLILEYLETIPEPGTTLKLGNLSVEILQAVDNAVKTARIRPAELPGAPVPERANGYGGVNPPATGPGDKSAGSKTGTSKRMA